MLYFEPPCQAVRSYVSIYTYYTVSVISVLIFRQLSPLVNRFTPDPDGRLPRHRYVTSIGIDSSTITAESLALIQVGRRHWSEQLSQTLTFPSVLPSHLQFGMAAANPKALGKRVSLPASFECGTGPAARTITEATSRYLYVIYLNT